MAPKAYISWSSGKDSAFAFLEAKRLGVADIVGALTTVNEKFDRVAMHGVRGELLDRQMAMLNIPAIRVSIPATCSNEIYEARFSEACVSIRSQGVYHIVFGDLFLEDVRAYREKQLAALGMEGLFPLWGRDTTQLATAMIESGLEAHVVCLDSKRLPPTFVGRRFDRAFLDDLPPDIDPCGENGEFHTVVTAGSMFSEPIAATAGERVTKEGFVFADMRLAESLF
jgi:uncharacterized protein (TIGR00290 family)